LAAILKCAKRLGFFLEPWFGLLLWFGAP